MAKRRRTRRHRRAVAHHTPHVRRRRRHHHRRRRNPSGGSVVSIVKSTIAAAIPALIAGGAMAVVDNKVLGTKALPIQALAKLGVAAGVGYALRARPRTAALTMGAIIGGLAYQVAAQLQGGIVATSTTDAAKKMSALVRADGRAMNALVNADGSLRTQPSLNGMGAGTELPTPAIYDPITLG